MPSERVAMAIMQNIARSYARLQRRVVIDCTGVFYVSRSFRAKPCDGSHAFHAIATQHADDPGGLERAVE